MKNTTQDNLLNALATYTFTPVEVEYKVYYDPGTMECVSKSTDVLPGLPGSYLVVDKDTYDRVEFCPWYYVKDGKVFMKSTSFNESTLLKRTVSLSQFATIKDNNIFAVDTNEVTLEVDYWTTKGYDD